MMINFIQKTRIATSYSFLVTLFPFLLTLGQALESNAQVHSVINKIEGMITLVKSKHSAPIGNKDDQCGMGYYKRLDKAGPNEYFTLEDLLLFSDALKKFKLKKCDIKEKINSETRQLKKEIKEELDHSLPCSEDMNNSFRRHCEGMLTKFEDVIDKLGQGIQHFFKSDDFCDDLNPETLDPNLETLSALKCRFLKGYESQDEEIEKEIKEYIKRKKERMRSELKDEINRAVAQLFSSEIGRFIDENSNISAYEYYNGVKGILGSFSALEDLLKKEGYVDIFNEQRDSILNDSLKQIKKDAQQIINEEVTFDQISHHLFGCDKITNALDHYLKSKSYDQLIDVLQENKRQEDIDELNRARLGHLKRLKSDCSLHHLKLIHDQFEDQTKICLTREELDQQLSQIRVKGVNQTLNQFKSLLISREERDYQQIYNDTIKYNKDVCYKECEATVKDALTLKQESTDQPDLIERIRRLTEDQSCKLEAHKKNEIIQNHAMSYLKEQVTLGSKYENVKNVTSYLIELDRLVSLESSNDQVLRYHYQILIDQIKTQVIEVNQELSRSIKFIILNKYYKKNREPPRYYSFIYVDPSTIHYSIDSKWLNHFILPFAWIRYYQGFKDCNVMKKQGKCPEEQQRKKEVKGFYLGLTELKYDHLRYICKSNSQLSVCTNKKYKARMKTEGRDSVHSLSLNHLVELIEILKRDASHQGGMLTLPTYDQYLASTTGHNTPDKPLPLRKTFEELDASKETRCDKLLLGAEGYIDGRSYQDPKTHLAELYTLRKELTRTTLIDGKDGNYRDLNLEDLKGTTAETNLIIAGGQSISDYQIPLQCLSKWYEVMNMEFGDSEVTIRLAWTSSK